MSKPPHSMFLGENLLHQATQFRKTTAHMINNVDIYHLGSKCMSIYSITSVIKCLVDVSIFLFTFHWLYFFFFAKIISMS